MQKVGYVPSQLSGHKPWSVQESAGPMAGLASQNCVWSNRPFAMKQHESVTSVEL